MTTRRWRRAAAVAASGALAVAGLVLVGNAQAAPNQYAPSIGFATGSPLSGSVASAPTVVTSAACPTGTTAINAFVDSAGAGLAGAVAISSNTTDIGNVSTTGITFSFNLLDVASSQGKTLVNGRYELSIVCLPDLFGSPGKGQFDAVFTVSGGATATSAGTSYTFAPGGNITGTSTAIAANPPVQGRLAPPQDDITLTATVTPGAAGTLQFAEVPAGGGAPIALGAPVTVDAGGRAALSLGSLANPPGSGAHSFVATFTPADPRAFAESTSPALRYQIIGAGQTPTTTTLAADPPVSVLKGNPLTLTARVDTVPPGGTLPAGTVTFLNGQAPLAEAPLTGATASVTIRPDPAGTLTLRAVFVPADTTSFAGSTSTPDLTYLVSEPISEGPFLGLLTVTSPNEEGREGQGRAADLIQLKAAKPCPSGSTVVTMRISGPGAWEPGFSIATNGFFGAAGANAPTSQSVADVAGLNSLTIVPGLYFITATCRASAVEPGLGFFVGQLWFYDEANWLNADPAVVGIPTTVTFDVSPTGRADLGSGVVLTAVITPVSAPGKIAFNAASDGGDVPLGTVDLAAGKATLTTDKLALGLYYITAEYQPDGSTHNPSTSPEVVYAIARIVPPLPQRAAAVTGTAKVGRTVTCTALFRNASVLTYTWIKDGALLIGATKAGYRVTSSDAGHRLACRAIAANLGGVVYRESPPVVVGR